MAWPELFQELWRFGVQLAAESAGRPDAGAAGRTAEPVDLDGMRARAREAELRQDWRDAERLWTECIAVGDGSWRSHRGQLAARRKQGRETDGAFRALLSRFPDNTELHAEFAEMAGEAGDHAAALQRWTSMRQRFPTNPLGHMGEAKSLDRLGRRVEAELALTRAAALCPLEREPCIHLAIRAKNVQDWPSAEMWWRACLPRSRDVWWAHLGIAESLAARGLFAEAAKPIADLKACDPGEQAQAPLAIMLLRTGAHVVPGSLDGLAEAIATMTRSDECGVGPWLAHALFAQHAGDAELSRVRLEHAARLFPDDPMIRGELAKAVKRATGDAGVCDRAAALAEAGHVEAAAAAVTELLDRRPAVSSDALVRLGEVALRLSDAGLAALCVRRLQRIAPADPALPSLRRGLAELRAGPSAGEAGSGQEAFLQAARSARDRGDHAAAVEAWAETRRHLPGNLEAYVWGAHARGSLGRAPEADAVLEQAIERFPGEVAPLLDHARQATRQVDWPEATRRWRTLRERFPELCEGYWMGAKVGRLSGARDEADALLTAAETEFPPSIHVDVERAYLWFDQRRWDDAEAAFARLRANYPNEQAGYLGGFGVLRHQGRMVEAERFMLEAMEKRPDDPILMLEYAKLPVAEFLYPRQDWNEAISRCRALHTRLPDFDAGNATLLQLLREDGRTADAEAFVADAVRRQPHNANLAVEHARNAAARGDWPEAAQRFADARSKFPANLTAHVGLASALARASRLDEADEVARAAIAAFPRDAAPFLEHASVAARRNDFGEAVRRVTEALRVLPGNQQLQQRLFELQLRLAEAEGTGGAPAAAPMPTPPGSSLTPRDMILGFESLGGSRHGCEFGLVQRALGAEPLGLLRWTEMLPDQLADALEREFAGVGLPEHTVLHAPAAGGRAEYMMSDRRFGMQMHTFIAFEDADADQLYPRLCRRLVYLRDKLLADLRSGEKIFVFKQTARDISDAEMIRLRAAMRHYGDNTLLCVRYADADHSDGSVEQAEPGLLVGYLKRFGVKRSGEAAGAVTASWEALCRNAHALHRSLVAAST